MASLKCDICAKKSTTCCVHSQQFYCDDCLKQHKQEAATQWHSLIKDFTQPLSITCKSCDKEPIAKLCLSCKKVYCTNCSDRHPKFAATRGHSTVSLNDFQGSICTAMGEGNTLSRPYTSNGDRSISATGAQVSSRKDMLI